MLENITYNKTSFSMLLKKVLIIICAVLTMAAVLSIILLMMKQLSPKYKNKYHEILNKEKKLQQSIDYQIIDAGYSVIKVENRDIYIPTLIVQISNKTEKAIPELILTAYFNKGEIPVCASSCMVGVLNSGDSSRVVMNCIESTGFGSVLKGLNLRKAQETLHFKLKIASSEATILAIEDSLIFKMINP